MDKDKEPTEKNAKQPFTRHTPQFQPQPIQHVWDDGATRG